MRVDDYPGAKQVERLPGQAPGQSQELAESFGQALDRAVRTVDQSQKAADEAIQDLAVGRTNRLHETMMAVEEAELSLKMLLQVRNKALEAYREIMRMQI